MGVGVHGVGIVATHSMPSGDMSSSFVRTILDGYAAEVMLPTPGRFDSRSLPRGFGVTTINIVGGKVSVDLFSSPKRVIITKRSNNKGSIPIGRLVSEVVRGCGRPFSRWTNF